MKYALKPNDGRKVRFYSSNLCRLPAKLRDNKYWCDKTEKSKWLHLNTRAICVEDSCLDLLCYATYRCLCIDAHVKRTHASMQ